MNETQTLEIGRDPGGNTDSGPYILRAIRAAQDGQRTRVIRHGQPVALITPARMPEGPHGYDPAPDLAALIDGMADLLRIAHDPAALDLLAALATGPYARLRGGLLLDEPGRENTTTENALRELIAWITPETAL